MIGIVTNTPPFSSMSVQRLEGGFACTTPPGAPVVARKSSDVAAIVRMFLSSEKLDELPDYEYKWPEATVPEGSVFNISKVPRVHKSKLIKQGGYLVAYHMASASSQTQFAAFNQATVMDRLQQWIVTAPEEELVEDQSALLTLSGMRINPDMDAGGETVFIMVVQPAAQVEDFASQGVFVARCADPQMAIGIVDEEVVGYLAEELGEDFKGEFAARVHEQYLEFGPRKDVHDESDQIG